MKLRTLSVESAFVCFRVSSMERYASLSRDEVLGNIPMMFITFPSAKDPTSNIRQPGSTLSNRHLEASALFLASPLREFLALTLCREILHDAADHGSLRVVRGMEGDQAGQKGAGLPGLEEQHGQRAAGMGAHGFPSTAR